MVRSAHPGVERLLRHLLAATVVVDGGWEEAVDVTLAFPDVVAVTRAGDRISAVGWRLGVGAPGATRAALDEARTAGRRARRQRRRGAARRLRGGHRRPGRRHRRRRPLARPRHRPPPAATASSTPPPPPPGATPGGWRPRWRRSGPSATGPPTGCEQEAARVAELELLLPALDDHEAAGAARLAAERAARQRIQARAEALVALRAELEVRAAGLDDSRTALARRLAEVEARLEGAAARRQESESRRAGLLATRAGLDRLGPYLDGRLAEVDAALDDVRRRRDAAVRGPGRGRRRPRRAAPAPPGRRAAPGRAAGAGGPGRAGDGRGPAAPGDRRGGRCAGSSTASRRWPWPPPAPRWRPGANPAARVRDLERELRLMGPVNPLALQELEALQERHAFLTEQLDDIKGSRRELLKIIRAVEAEMSELLTAALADVTEHFAALFETLFPGGQGRLHITDPDHVLEAGLELDCRPAGKNVRKLSLLSGGERALCALAFLFAVFRSRPSPFYLLDEVEAALDDVNLHRFIDLLHQFREEAQLVVVTHQKRTMEAADSLYGVTLQPGGLVQGGVREGAGPGLATAGRTVSVRGRCGVTYIEVNGDRPRASSRCWSSPAWSPPSSPPVPARAPTSTRPRPTSLPTDAAEAAARQEAAPHPLRGGARPPGHASWWPRPRRCWPRPSPSPSRSPRPTRAGPSPPPSADGPVVVPAPDAEPEVPPEPAPKPRFRDRLGKARGLLAGYLGAVRTRDKIDEETWDDLEEALLRADVGVGATTAAPRPAAGPGQVGGHHHRRRPGRRPQGGPEEAPHHGRPQPAAGARVPQRVAVRGRQRRGQDHHHRQGRPPAGRWPGGR